MRVWPGLHLIGAGGKIPKGVFVAVAEVEPDGVRLDNGMRLKNQELLRATRPSHAVTYASCQGLTLHNRVRLGLESSPTSAGRLRHQREHRELLVVQPRGPPEGSSTETAARGKLRDAGLDEFVIMSSPDMLRSAVERNLLRDERPLLLDELQISSSNIGAQNGGVDTLKHLLGLSPDLPATIKCRYNDVKVPAETFRIITVQNLAKLHHNLDDMAKVRPPDLMLEGFEWRARPLDKVFDADTRAVLKRCILVEVTAQCVKDSVREKRKFGSDKAISMAESLRALYNGQ